MKLNHWQQLSKVEQKALIDVIKKCNIYKYTKIKVVINNG